MENELTIVSDTGRELSFTQIGGRTYSSYLPKTNEEKVTFYNLINGDCPRLISAVNVPIALKDVYAEECEFIDKESGEASNGIRIILIAEDGTAYACASKGIFMALTKLFRLFGEPRSWKKPLTVIPQLLQRGDGRQVLTIKAG